MGSTAKGSARHSTQIPEACDGAVEVVHPEAEVNVAAGAEVQGRSEVLRVSVYAGHQRYAVFRCLRPVAEIFMIFEGTSEIQRMLIGRASPGWTFGSLTCGYTYRVPRRAMGSLWSGPG
jgi:hypothetical protein